MAEIFRLDSYGSIVATRSAILTSQWLIANMFGRPPLNMDRLKFLFILSEGQQPVKLELFTAADEAEFPRASASHLALRMQPKYAIHEGLEVLSKLGFKPLLDEDQQPVRNVGPQGYGFWILISPIEIGGFAVHLTKRPEEALADPGPEVDVSAM